MQFQNLSLKLKRSSICIKTLHISRRKSFLSPTLEPSNLKFQEIYLGSYILEPHNLFSNKSNNISENLGQLDLQYGCKSQVSVQRCIYNPDHNIFEP